jgi:hypothetical protein
MASYRSGRPIQLACVMWLFAVVLAVLGCGSRPFKAADLRVYFETARSFFDQSGPMYGPNSVLGWPMIYRYPPLFLCLFRPLSILPLRAATGLWAALKVSLLGPLVWLWSRRFPPARPFAALSIPTFLLLPYLVHELVLGNVQLLIVELVCFGLLLSDGHPLAGGSLLGLATAIKVWPVFLLPYLVLRRRWRVAVHSSWASAVLTLTPGLWLGWKNLFHLLVQWATQEKGINATLGDKWYPSQSLRGVMLRYLTRMDYSSLPDRNYRLVNFVSLPSAEVRHVWLVLALCLVAFTLVWVYRCTDDAAAYSIFFCFLLIIQATVATILFVTLLWPALYAGHIMADTALPRVARGLLIFSAVSAAIIPVLPGSVAQRQAQALGAHFFAVLLPLTLAIVVCAKRREQRTGQPTRP